MARGNRISKKGKGSNLFKSNKSTSNSAPRAKGAAGKGGNWRAGIPMHNAGGAGSASGRVGPANNTGRPAAQGSSLANMGDQMSATGHNAPRGYFDPAQAQRGILATGSTPLTRKKYSAAKVRTPDS